MIRLISKSRKQYLMVYLITFFTCVLPDTQIPVVLNNLQFGHEHEKFIKHTAVIFTVLPDT